LKTVSTLLTALLALLLLIAAYFGLIDGLRAVRVADGPLRLLVSATQLLAGLLALAALIALGFGHRATGALLVGWVATLAMTNGLSPVVWRHDAIAVGIKSGVITGTWLGLAVWLWGYCHRRATRGASASHAA
jgi:hypothetical protein